MILTKDHTQAFFFKKLLVLLLSKHTVYWLTTHCKGETTTTISYLTQFLNPDTLELVKKVKPTNWNTYKTEAIDFSKDFIWLDGYLIEAEKETLREMRALDSWIPVDLQNNPNQLKSVYTRVSSDFSH